MNTLGHGGDLKKFAGQFGIQIEDIVDFSSNVTPLGLPETVREIYPDLLWGIVSYPDPFASELRAEIAGYYSFSPENVVAGNGSMGVLSLVIRSLAPKRALIVEPCFSEYRRLLHLSGAQIRSVALSERNQFQFSLKELLESLAGVDFLILGHPNNPTGTALSCEQLQELLCECGRRNVFTVIDEAFVDWCPPLSVACEIKKNSSLIVLRSLTKFYGLAGVRAGYGLSSKRLIETLQARQEPWSMNGIAQALSIAALRDENFRIQSLRWFEEESRWFCEGLSALEGFQVFPSRANFFLIKAADKNARDLYRFCGEKGFYIRTLENFPGLGDSFFRLSIRKRAENERILTLLKEWTVNNFQNDPIAFGVRT